MPMATPDIMGTVDAADTARNSVIEGLRAHIRRIEGSADFAGAGVPSGGDSWTLGIEVIDRLLGPRGLEAGGVHEIRAEAVANGTSAAAATASRRAFALMLGMRRLLVLPRARPIVWCLPLALLQETGAPYSRGLGALGLDCSHLVLVTPRKAQDVLWVIEEAVRTPSLALVLGEVAGVGATAARRLSLASAGSGTPCLLVSPDARAPVLATATRWRVAPRASAADPLDPLAPGASGFQVALERCRARPLVSCSNDYAVEWCDGARCFRLAAPVSDRALAPDATRLSPPDATALRKRTA